MLHQKLIHININNETNIDFNNNKVLPIYLKWKAEDHLWLNNNYGLIINELCKLLIENIIDIEKQVTQITNQDSLHNNKILTTSLIKIAGSDIISIEYKIGLKNKQHAYSIKKDTSNNILEIKDYFLIIWITKQSSSS